MKKMMELMMKKKLTKIWKELIHFLKKRRRIKEKKIKSYKINKE